MTRRYRSTRASTPRVSRWMALKYPAACKVCRAPIAAGATAYYDYNARTATCGDPECTKADGLTREEWRGSPVSGGYVTVTAERRLGEGYRTWKQRYGRCEDAPCCGCCS